MSIGMANIGSRAMEQTGDNRAPQFLIQKIAFDVHREMLHL